MFFKYKKGTAATSEVRTCQKKKCGKNCIANIKVKKNKRKLIRGNNNLETLARRKIAVGRVIPIDSSK